jgi:type I restriction enzyme, S subunit
MMMKKIGEVCELVSGYAFKSSEFKLDSQKGLPIIRIQNVGNPNSDFVYWESSYDEKFLVNEEDILLSLSGSVKVDIWKGPKALLNQRIVKIIPKSCVNKKWIYWAIHKKIDDISNIGKKSIINNISVNELKKLDIYVPNLEQQNAIVSVLNKAQELIDKRKAQIEALDQLTQSVFLEMFGDPILNKKQWPKKKLGNICSIVRGGSPRPIEKFLGGHIPWIKISDATKGDSIYLKNTKEFIIEEGVKKSRLIKKGSLIFANCGVSLGFARIITFDGCIHDGWLAFEDIPNYVNKIFLLKLLNQFTDYFRKTAPDGTQPNLNTTIMKNFEVILPPIELQNRFADIVLKIESQKDLLQKSLEELENNFSSLMQQAFKGELFND